MSAYKILKGVGKIYLAQVGTTFPTLDQDPAIVSGWTYVGPTADGIDVAPDETINEFSSDQDIGSVDAIRSDEKVMLSANLFEATLENIGRVMAQAVAVVAAGTGTVGYKKIGLSRGVDVTLSAILYRFKSPYGPYPAQIEIPFGYISGKISLKWTKADKVVVPAEFHALIDPDATSDEEKFGRAKFGNAAAL